VEHRHTGTLADRHRLTASQQLHSTLQHTSAEASPVIIVGQHVAVAVASSGGCSSGDAAVRCMRSIQRKHMLVLTQQLPWVGESLPQCTMSTCIPVRRGCAAAVCGLSTCGGGECAVDGSTPLLCSRTCAEP
jgi:hypothetical protein